MIFDYDRKIIAFVVSLALFMDALDTTIINTAIPAMAHSLQVNPIDLKVALITYLLSLATFVPISGWMVDKYGSKRVFCCAITLFTLSSFWCGYASTLTELVIGRSIQGMGGAFMLPVCRLILLRTFARHEFIHAMNRVSIIVAGGLMLGPFAGGMITDYFSWPWIFWVNLPIGIFALMVAIFKFEGSEKIPVQPLDGVGFILFGGGLAAITFALSDLSESFSDPAIACTILIVAFAMLTSYFLRRDTHYHPIFNTKLLQIRTFRIAFLGNILSRLGIGGVPFLLPLLLQVNLGYSARLAGLLLMPTAVGVLLVNFIGLRALKLMGYKRLLIVSTLLSTLILIAFAQINIKMPLHDIALLNFAYGLIIALQLSTMNSLGYSDLPVDDLSSATSIMGATQQVALSFGVAAAALLLRYYSIEAPLEAKLLSQAAFQITFITMGLITACANLVLLILNANDGQSMLLAKDKTLANNDACQLEQPK